MRQDWPTGMAAAFRRFSAGENARSPGPRQRRSPGDSTDGQTRTRVGESHSVLQPMSPS